MVSVLEGGYNVDEMKARKGSTGQQWSGYGSLARSCAAHVEALMTQESKKTNIFDF